MDKERDELVNYLQNNSIPTAVFYKKPFNLLKLYNHENNKLNFDISIKLSKTILSLPMHPYLSRKDQDYIIALIKEFYEK